MWSWSPPPGLPVRSAEPMLSPARSSFWDDAPCRRPHGLMTFQRDSFRPLAPRRRASRLRSTRRWAARLCASCVVVTGESAGEVVARRHLAVRGLAGIMGSGSAVHVHERRRLTAATVGPDSAPPGLSGVSGALHVRCKGGQPANCHQSVCGAPVRHLAARLAPYRPTQALPAVNPTHGRPSRPHFATPHSDNIRSTSFRGVNCRPASRRVLPGCRDAVRIPAPLPSGHFMYHLSTASLLATTRDPYRDPVAGDGPCSRAATSSRGSRTGQERFR